MRSNRQLLAKMTEWGWADAGRSTERVNGTRVEGRTMVWPETGELLLVRDSSHKGNPAPVFHRIVRLTCRGDEAAFWRGPLVPVEAPPPIPTPAPTVSQHGRKAAPPRPSSPKRRDEGPSPTPPLPDTDKETTVTTTPRPQLNRGTAERAFAYVRDAGKALTTREVGRALGIERIAAGNALNHLVSTGALVRVKAGVFAVAPATSSRVEHAGHVDHDHGAAAVAPAPTSPPPAVVAPAPVQRPMTDLSALAAVPADVLDVLDLLMPDGIKTAKLPAVLVWIEATKALLA